MSNTESKHWETPPIIKVYEALGAVADKRVVPESDTKAKVYSSSRGKHYTVECNSVCTAIMSNDNASFYKGYLGYPAIAFLFIKDILPFRADLAEALKEIAWKDLNQLFKNDFEKTLEYIEKNLAEEEKNALKEYTIEVLEAIKDLGFTYLGEKTTPPQGY